MPRKSTTNSARWLILFICQVTEGLSLIPHKQPLQPKNDVRQGLSVRRNEVLDYEERLRMGSGPKFTADESAVNNILSSFKDAEINSALNDSSKFLSSHHFFRAKERIEQSEVFKLIQLLPKGALLHGHNTALVSSEWFIRNVTYRAGLIMYTTDRGVVRFTFRRPERLDWKYVADMRSAASNIREFDRYLETHINLYTAQPEIDYPDIDVVWRKFQNMFETIKEAVVYYPVFVDFHYQMLQEMLDDNIMYAEIRTGASELYDDNGRTYSSVEAVQILQNIVTDFRLKNPNFFGAKLIYTASRRSDPSSYEDINTYRELQ